MSSAIEHLNSSPFLCLWIHVCLSFAFGLYTFSNLAPIDVIAKPQLHITPLLSNSSNFHGIRD
ncbi:hypothetical protein F5148DRAFT_1289293 [Russula earlei]|uniref:Uncharacterized protein n=1 Tax=Russula earlei TaxID=71964 RepID=A0ACC0TYU9_9AGAM|nr:hypothetical protein F5148DRAFT_1289293 [Russula earlei]